MFGREVVHLVKRRESEKQARLFGAARLVRPVLRGRDDALEFLMDGLQPTRPEHPSVPDIEDEITRRRFPQDIR